MHLAEHNLFMPTYGRITLLTFIISRAKRLKHIQTLFWRFLATLLIYDTILIPFLRSLQFLPSSWKLFSPSSWVVGWHLGAKCLEIFPLVVFQMAEVNRAIFIEKRITMPLLPSSVCYLVFAITEEAEGKKLNKNHNKTQSTWKRWVASSCLRKGNIYKHFFSTIIPQGRDLWFGICDYLWISRSKVSWVCLRPIWPTQNVEVLHSNYFGKLALD